MRRGLTDTQRAHFDRVGYLAPVDVLDADEVERCRRGFDELVRRHGPRLNAGARHKPHLYAKWASDLVHHPKIVGAVADLLGPDVLALRSVFFVKPAGDSSYIAWHQDETYYHLEPPLVVTAWIALSDSSRDNGCVQVIAGSHTGGLLPHVIRYERGNNLLRGQTAEVALDQTAVRDIELCAGQMSLHHVRLVHGSRENPTATARVGLAIRYVPTRVRQRGPRQSATLVCGRDEFHYFDPEPVPRNEADGEALAAHRRSLRRYVAQMAWEALRLRPRDVMRSVTRILASRDARRTALQIGRGWFERRPNGE